LNPLARRCWVRGPARRSQLRAKNKRRRAVADARATNPARGESKR
jgi:hypothetical protein